MSDKRNEKGTCVYEKDIHVSHKGQGAATNRELEAQPTEPVSLTW